MAIAFDASSSGGSTFAHTCSGNDRLLVASVQAYPANDTISGVTYNGVSMTLIAKRANTSGVYDYLFYLLNPASGTHDVVISGTGLFDDAVCSYTGVGYLDSSNTNQASSSTFSVSTTVVASNCWYVGCGQINNGQVLTGIASGYLRKPTSSWNSGIIDSNGTVGTGTQGISATIASSQNFVAIIASFAPLPPSSSSQSPSLSPSSSASPSISPSESPSRYYFSPRCG